MKIYPRGSSPYLYADLVHPGTGKRIRVSTRETTKGAAKRAALAILNNLQREAEQIVGGLNPTTLRRALYEYVSWLEDHGKASAADQRALAGKLLGEKPGRWSLDGDRWLHSLEPQDLENLTRARMREGNSAQTIAHEIKLLRAATRYAAGLRKRVPELLCNGAVRDAWRLPELPEKTRYLSPVEFRSVYDYLSPDRPVRPANGEPYVPAGQRYAERQDAQDLLVAIAMTGGRWQEVAQLTWDRVDLQGGMVRLYGTKDGEERLVGLPELAVTMLRRRAAERAPGQSLVFPGRDGRPRGEGSCQPILRAMNAVGLNSPEMVQRHGRATVHSLRHTYASWLLQRGADLAEVQDALGHASLTMTRRYAHLAKRKSAARLGGILTQATEDLGLESAPGGGQCQPAPPG